MKSTKQIDLGHNRDSKAVVQFAFTYKYELFTVRLFDDGTWEVTNLEGPVAYLNLEGPVAYLIQQGSWKVEALSDAKELGRTPDHRGKG